jgi:hypothetical protein
MLHPLKCIWFTACIALVLVVSPVFGQDAPGQATETVASSGRPSTIRIKQNILLQKQEALQRQVDDALRCIATASNLQTLRDPQGNINLVPQTDLVNCRRQLLTYQRELQSLLRQSSRLGSDATAASLQLQRQLQVVERAARLRWLSE